MRRYVVTIHIDMYFDLIHRKEHHATFMSCFFRRAWQKTDEYAPMDTNKNREN